MIDIFDKEKVVRWLGEHIPGRRILRVQRMFESGTAALEGGVTEFFVGLVIALDDGVCEYEHTNVPLRPGEQALIICDVLGNDVDEYQFIGYRVTYEVII